MLLFLSIGYIWVLFLFIFMLIVEPTANVRGVLTILGVCPVLIIHILASMQIKAWKNNKKFFLVSLLWSSYFILTIIAEGLSIFLQEVFIIIDLVNLFLLFIILISTFLSLLLNYPFFYTKTKSKIVILIGIVGICSTLFIGIQIVAALIDLYLSHGSLIIKL